MSELWKVFNLNGFILTKETSKSMEFVNIHNNEIVYILPNKEMTIVLNPRTVDSNEELKSKSLGLRHSTALTQFPKRKHTGEGLIPYGYSFKFESDEGLGKFLADFTKVKSS